LLGQTLAKQKIQVVYGGSNVGLMRALADGALAGGTVIGVLPDFKKRGGTSRFDRINRGKHARAKMKMNDGDGVIASTGGFGTLEELLKCSLGLN
jgi:uncharacterized protein (TIGR00725 family)